MTPDAVADPVSAYLRLADRLLPGRITGFYLIGSVALGAYRPGHSDIDFVAVVDDGDTGNGDGGLSPRELRRLRAVHLAAGARTAGSALVRGRLALPGTCNGVYVRAGDLTRPVSAITPLASHTGTAFSVGCGFDVNPVQWRTLASRGVAVRGPEPATLGLDPEPALLRRWNLDNLASYWVPWAERIHRGPTLPFRTRPRWWTAWGVLGPARMHHTIATGEVVSKEDAGAYARDTFDACWHPLVDDALALRRDEPTDPGFAARVPDVRTRARLTAEFALEVAGSAAAL